MAAVFARFVTYYETANNLKHRAEGAVTQFADAASIAPWALPSVQQCQIYGLIKGVGGRMYLPEGTSTRAQVAAVIHRLSWTDAGPVNPPSPDPQPEPEIRWTITLHDGDTVTRARVKNGWPHLLPVLTAEHRAFKGWAAAADSKTVAYAPGALIPSVFSDMELWAVWVDTVTLHNEGDADRVVEAEVLPFTAPAAPADAKGGRVFMGWEPEAGGGTLYVPGTPISPTPTDLYAVWGWTVTLYHGDTIFNSGGNPQVIRDGGTYTIPAPPAPGPHQVFKGWSTDKDGPVNTSYREGDKITVEQDITLYAIFGTTFTVTVKNGDETIDQQEIELNERYTIPAAPTKGGAHTGCHFMGWTDELNGDVKSVYKSGEAIGITQDLTLYAVWGHWVKVFNHTQAGDTPDATYEIKDGDTYTTPAAPTPAPDRTVFAGWALTKDGGVAYAAEETVAVSADLELHAVWANVYTVTLMNGSEEYAKSAPLQSGQSYVIGQPPAASGIAGHTDCVFMGWAASEGGQIKYATGSTVTVDNADITLYAVWGHTVTLYDQETGGTWTPHEGDSVTVRHGDVYSIPEDTHAPHAGADCDIFLGWAGDDTRSAASYSAQVKYAAGDNLTGLTGNVGLYAIWGHDYISQAVEDSATWFNDQVKDATMRAVAKLETWINNTLRTDANVEDGFTDALRIDPAVYTKTGGRTVRLSLSAVANSSSALAVTEFALRYAYALHNGSADSGQLKESLRALVLDILSELGYEDTSIDREKLDKFVDELAAASIQDFKDQWYNRSGMSCVGSLTVTVGAQAPMVISVPGASRENFKELARSLTKDLASEAQMNADWTSDMALTSTITVAFTPVDEIAAAYQTAAKEDGRFPTEYTVTVSLSGRSDYLAYKYENGHYAKVIVPERMKDAYNARMPGLVSRALASEVVQNYLKQISDEIENKITSSLQYSMVQRGLSKFDTSFGLTPGMGGSLGEQMHQWLIDNYLAPDSNGEMDIMESFLVTGGEGDNSALYDLVTENSAEAKVKTKEKLDAMMDTLPNEAGVLAGFLHGSPGGSVEVDVQLPLGHNPQQLIMNTITGSDTQAHPENLIAAIENALNTIEADLTQVEQTYLTAKTNGQDSEKYPELTKLLTEMINRQYSYYASTWDNLKNVGLIRAAVGNGKENVEKIRNSISSAKTVLNGLKVNVSNPVYQALLQPVLTYFYADVVGAYTGSGVSEDITNQMQGTMDACISTLITNTPASLDTYLDLAASLRALQHFDALWETKFDGLLTLLGNDLVKQMMDSAVLTEDMWGALDKAAVQMEALLNKLPDSAAITIGSQTFGKTEFTAVLAAVKAHNYGDLISTLESQLGSLADISLADITEGKPILITVTYEGSDVRFCLVLERPWKTA